MNSKIKNSLFLLGMFNMALFPNSIALAEYQPSYFANGVTKDDEINVHEITKMDTLDYMNLDVNGYNITKKRFKTLNEKQKRIYLAFQKIIEEGLNGKHIAIKIGDEKNPIPNDLDMFKIFKAYNMDNPESDYLYIGKLKPLNEKQIFIDPLYSIISNSLGSKTQYYLTLNRIQIEEEKNDLKLLENKKQEIHKEILKNKGINSENPKEYMKEHFSKLEIEKELYNYLVSHIKYDYNLTVQGNENLKNNFGYGALMTNKTICGGFSSAFSLLLNDFDIENTVISGSYLNSLHSRNLVKIDDVEYEVDVTFGSSAKNAGLDPFIYFNKTEEEMNKIAKLDRID